MPQPTDDFHGLPENPSPLGLKLSFPQSSLAFIERGYESQNQDEKWSIYFRKPWVQIWRPSLTGWYCYAVRFEQADDQLLRVVNSWVGSCILDPVRGLGPDLERHREIVTWVLDNVAGYSGVQFNYEFVAGTRHRKKVTFSGEATSLEEVDEIEENLRAEIAHMLKDGH